MFADGKLAWSGDMAQHGFEAASDGRYVYLQLGPGRHALRSEEAR